MRLVRVSALSWACFAIAPSLCHMQMSWPYPLRSQFNPSNTHENIDYSMTDPLNSDGSNFPCKGYQNNRPIQPVVTYTAGSTYNMTLAGSAMHDGGSCQLSLSYDNGATFRVIKSMIGGCPLVTTYDFTIPAYAPAGVALLSWTWQNLVGNREYYMNCAEVNIAAASQKKHHRRQIADFYELPYMWKGNLQGINNCITQANVAVVYPEPGPDVIYGGGLSSSIPATAGECDSPLPYWRTYENLTDMGAQSVASFQQALTTMSFGAGVASLAQIDGSTAPSSSLAVLQPSTGARKYVAQPEERSTTTITVGCQPTITLSTMPTYYITAAACTGTRAVCPCRAGYSCQELSPCIWGCKGTPAHTSSVPKRSTPAVHLSSTKRTSRFITTTRTIVHVKPTPSPHHPPAGGNGRRPPYVGSDAHRYLPCVPGTFICINSQTWDTCDYNAKAQWVYEYPRKVAAGMKCLPSLSRYGGGTLHYGQQGLTRKGYYRNDQIVRA